MSSRRKQDTPLGIDVTVEHKPRPPQMAIPAAIDTDPKRVQLSRALYAYAGTLHKRPVQSNAELLERAEEYFKYCADWNLYPTMEGLAVYLGYSHEMYHRWTQMSGERFKDGDIPTSDILERIRGIIEAIDGDLVVSGAIPAVPWIFKRKAQSGWSDAPRPDNNLMQGADPDCLSPEQIIKILPYLPSDDDII